MMHRWPPPLPALLVLASILGPTAACDWPWALDNPLDPGRCSPACGGGLRCVDGRCVVSVEAGVPDGAPDAGPDLDAAPAGDRPPYPDFGPPDAPPADFPPPDPLTWITIPSGTFSMGAASGDQCAQKNETAHSVTLTHTFEILETPVTQGQYFDLMGRTCHSAAGALCGPPCPADQANWHVAAEFCNRLSTTKGLTACYTCTGSGNSLRCSDNSGAGGIYKCPGYRLPTEAEWEYAYRAGSQVDYYPTASQPGQSLACIDLDTNLDAVAWYGRNSGMKLRPVAGKLPNKWGLHDMAGNVFEWVHDGYEENLGTTAVTDPVEAPGNFGVRRGGYYGSYAQDCRAAFRLKSQRILANQGDGFRCARTLGP